MRSEDFADGQLLVSDRLEIKLGSGFIVTPLAATWSALAFLVFNFQV